MRQRTVEQMGTLGSMDIGASGHWGQMSIGGETGTRKNEHQNKWAFMRQMGTVEQMGTLGPMDIGAILGKIDGKWTLGGNGHQEK